MGTFGINLWFLLIQATFVALLIGLPIISLIDLAKKKLSGTTLALWALIICAIPVLGALAYWIVKPSADARQ